MNDDPQPSTAAANPYSFGTMITDPTRFVGRCAELATIMARLNGQQSEGSAIWELGLRTSCHAREGGHPAAWIPAFAGMTWF